MLSLKIYSKLVLGFFTIYISLRLYTNMIDENVYSDKCLIDLTIDNYNIIVVDVEWLTDEFFLKNIVY